MSTFTLDKQAIDRWASGGRVKVTRVPDHVVLKITHNRQKQFLSMAGLRLLTQGIAAGRNKQATLLARTLGSIVALRRLGENWNGHDAAAPMPTALLKAVSWTQMMSDEVWNRGWVWHEPHISASEEGEVVLEWWQAPKSLTVYVSPEGMDYIQDNGMGGPAEMGDGSANTTNERLAMWQWMFGED